MAESVRQIEKPYLLVVEGREEELFFDAACRHFRIENVQILGVGGKTKLAGNLAALVRTPGFSQVRSVGIARDADNDPAAATQSIQHALSKVGLPVPPAPLVPHAGPPRVAFFLFPDCRNAGTLEDLCLLSVALDKAMACVEEFFRCLNNRVGALPREMAKAKLSVFLASRPEPDKRLGEAAQAGFFPWSHPAFSQLEQFLRIVGGTP